jgi:hypothetical protein
MSDPTITCPNCRNEIKLTESLAAPLIESTRRQLERQIAEKETEITRREATVREQQQTLSRERESLQAEVEQRLKSERSAIAADEAKKARAILASDLESKVKEVSELQEILKHRDAKLAEAQKAQADVLRKQRELDDAKREIELTIEKRIQQSLAAARDQAKKEATDELKLKVAEKEQTILSMQRQIEELKRKAEQGSQQLQGEVQELELESILRSRFPHDVLEPVPKGEHGGDMLQRVFSGQTKCCGTILWESKRTKHWSDGWLAKLREDQRAARAEFAVIVSQALPNEVEVFDQIDGVWITSPRTIVPIALALRQSLVELAKLRQAGEGQQTKMEMVYQYLIGSRFRHRIQAIVEKFTEMHTDLEKERRTMTRMWAKREQQIRIAVESTAGMYGDLQGIAGRTLLEIEGLEPKFLESRISDE